MPSTSSLRLLLWLACALTAAPAGCITAASSDVSSSSTKESTSTQDYTDGNAGLDSSLFPNLRIRGEPNDTFSQALEVIFDASGGGSLRGTISGPQDVDVYALGALVAGDRIVVDMGTPDGQLDSTIAIFDADGLIAFQNDDRNIDLGQLDAFINQVVRHDSANYYLGIAGSAYASRGATTGRYEALITIVHGEAVPATSSQLIALNFTGGTITIPDYATYTVTAFDTADIANVYSGMTETVRAQIVTTVREAYTGLAVEFLVFPGDSTPPEGAAYSTVFFGADNREAFGLSQQVDPYNTDHGDCAIIFTETFTPQVFGRVLTATQLGTAIGNVAAHEIGHLLGLNHVANIYDLMDTTGGSSTLLAEQTFTTSVLDDSIFPLGSQDGLALLLETLGSAP